MKVSLLVKKMKCDGCVKTIAETLLMLDGLSNVEVDLESKTVSFDAKTKEDADVARKSLQRAGFPGEDQPGK